MLPANFPSDLSVETADRYSVSIRVFAGGLTFSLSRIDGEEQIACIEERLDAGYTNLTAAVSEIFFRNPCFCYPYKHATALLVPYSYVLTPADLYEEARGHFWLQAVEEEPEDGSRTEVQPFRVPDASKLMLLSYDSELVHFLRRTLLVLEVRPYFADRLVEVSRLSSHRKERCLCLSLRAMAVDAFLLTAGDLMYANPFSLTLTADNESAADELLFYLFTLWKTLALNAENDRLFLCAEGVESKSLLPSFHLRAKAFIRHIDML